MKQTNNVDKKTMLIAQQEMNEHKEDATDI